MSCNIRSLCNTAHCSERYVPTTGHRRQNTRINILINGSATTISISPGLYPFRIIFSTLFESRLVLLTELSDELSHCSAISAFMYTKFAAVHPSLVPGPLGFIICLSQNLILGILDSAHPVFGFDPGFLASASTLVVVHCKITLLL